MEINTFLIRNPEDIVKSYIFLCKKEKYIPNYEKELRFDKFYEFFCYI